MEITFALHLVNGLLMILFGIGLGIFLTERFHLDWRLWWIGAAVFILSQVLHIPFNIKVLGPLLQSYLPSLPSSLKLPVIALATGLSAGLFEELSRYSMYRWWTREARSWRKALLLGAGHGGAEAVILGVLVLMTLFQLAAIRDLDLATLVPPDKLSSAQQQVAAYWSSPWYAILLGALERSFSLPVQVCFSVVVLQVFTRGQMRWLWLAIAGHTLVDALAVYALSTWGPYVTEALIGICALVSIAVIFVLRQPEPAPQPPISIPTPSPIYMTRPSLDIEENPETLEKTRYN